MTKKLLTFLTLLTLFFGVGWAETATWPGTQALPGSATYVGTDTHIKIKTSSTNTYTNPIRIYANNTITITADNGYVINSVTYEASSTGNYVTYAQNATVTPNVTPTVSGKNVTWSFGDNVTEFTFKPSTQTRANSITITYEASGSGGGGDDPTPTTTTYERVSSISAADIGKKFILIYEGETPAGMGAVSTYGSSETGSSNLTVTNGVATLPSGSAVKILTLGGNTADGWTFDIGNNYYLSWSSGNTLNQATTLNNNSKWTVSFTDDEKAFIKNKQTPAREIQYNPSSPRFACYTSTQQYPCLYREVEAVAEKTYDVTVTQATGGTISASPSGEKVADEGDEITLSYEAAAGYQFGAWDVKDASNNTVTVTNNKFTMPASSVTVTATFSKIQYSITNVVKTNGEVSGAGGGLNNFTGVSTVNDVWGAQVGDVITFTANTYQGYQMLQSGISIKDADNNDVSFTFNPNNGNLVTFTMPASNVTVTANFTNYRGTLRLAGHFNGNSTWRTGNNGPAFTYNSSNDTYTIDAYFTGLDDGGANDYFFLTLDGAEKHPQADEGNYYIYELDGDAMPFNLSGGSNNNFGCAPGVYNIEINGALTSMKFTKKNVTFTYTPADGSSVYQNSTVTATSDMQTLLTAIKTTYDNDAVIGTITTQVSADNSNWGESATLSTTGNDIPVYAKSTLDYLVAKDTATYTVNEIPAGSEFELVTSNDDIGEGVEYVIMNKDSGSGYAMSTTQNNNNRGQTDLITIANSKIIPTNDTQIITLEAADDDGWYLKVASDPAKYLYTVNSSNYLKTGSNLNSSDQCYVAKISIAENSNVATIEYQTETKKYLRRNSSDNIFSCYKSGQQEVYLYKRGTVTPTVAIPTFSPEAGTYNEAQSVTISCATDGATILYSTDGTNYSNYTGAITVSETTTLYAKATKDGVTSQVATAEYTINIPVVGSGDFTLVENDNAIKAGREYIIISKNKDYAAGAYSSGRFAGSTSFTLTNDDKTASIQNDVKVFTLEDSETEGYYYLKDSEGNYYTPSQSSGDISQTKTNLSVTYVGGFVKITTSSDTRQIGFNDQNGQKKFGSFTNSSLNDSQGGLHHIYLYYRDGGLQKPEFTPAPGMYDVDVDVTITCATDGATIYYTTDDSEPSATNGTEYTGEIVVSQTTTFKAIAVKDGETSQIVSATYTITPHTAIETVTLTYSEPFTAGIGKFTVDNVSGFSPVWTLDGNYGIKGTSFSGGVNYAATSRFLSPIIDMTDATQPELTFSHQINSFFDDVTTQATLWIRETTDGTDGTWVQLPITFSDPAAAGGWTNDVVDIDLSTYAGKKVQISFLYTNPTEGSGAGTWEIQNFMVADNSEYRLVNNIAEFLALENGTKAKFKNPVTVLYDYAQNSSNSYHEYIWVKDESGFMQFYLIPTLNSDENSDKSAKAAYYENGDIIPAGFVVVKNYYENGDFVQAYSAEALEAGFQAATQKGLADPDYYDFTTLHNLDLSAASIKEHCNRYITLEKIKITSKSGKNFRFADENGTVNNCLGYNKYNGDGSLLKDGENSADVTVPDVSETLYNVKAILQLYKVTSGTKWEILPIEFTEWKAKEVTLRKLCADGEVGTTYTISNRLQCAYIREGNKLWVKDDNGQSILKKAPAEGDNNYEIGEEAGNKQLDQSLYDQSNWLEVHLADGSANAETFYRHIIKGGAITGTFTNKTNPTMENVVLTSTALENSDEIGGTVEYAPNYYCAANFYNGIEGGNQACIGSQHHGDFFFMNPKPQEYAMIVWAKYDGSSMFSVPTGNGANEHGFQGTFTVNLSMNPEGAFDPNNAENIGQVYNFEAIICRPSSGSKAGSGDYVVYPLNLSGDSVITNVVDVTGKTVAGRKYYNLAGMESDRPFEGVNIIVTTYTDGSRSSAKVLK